MGFLAYIPAILEAIFFVVKWIVKSPAWIIGILTTFGAYLTKLFGRKFAVFGVYLSIYMGLTTAFMGFVWPIIEHLANNTLPDWLIIPASWIIPSNLTFCVTTVFSVRFARYVYDLKLFFQKSIWSQM